MDMPPGIQPGDNRRLANQIAMVQKARAGSNQAAANAIPMQRAPVRHVPKGQITPYQGGQQAAPPPIPSGQIAAPPQMIPPAPRPQQMPQQGSAVSPAGSSADTDAVERFNMQQAVERLVDSPEMSDTVTRLQLREHFQKSANPNLGAEAFQIMKNTYMRGRR